MPAITKFQSRRGTTAAWTSANPILADGEIGWDTTAANFKVGDGSTVWTSLPYLLATALASKITGFTDPNADRIVFWDDSAGAYAALTASTGLTLSGTSLTVNAASETVSGRVELATAAETTTGTDATRAVHTAGLKAQKGIANGLASLGADSKIPDEQLPARLDQTTLDSTYANATVVDTKVREAVEDTHPPVNPMGNFKGLRKLGVIVDTPLSGTPSYDNLATESLTVFQDPESGRLAGVYTAYGDGTGVQRASIVRTYSDDGIIWDKDGVLLAGSGVAGSPDQNGCTGPYIVLHNGIYHLFYIGLTLPGYEAGDRSLCLATSPSLKNPTWTRHGIIMSPGGTGWRAQDVWHPNIVRKDGLWYCFVNATGADGHESIGYATATDLLGPWTFQDANCPLISKGATNDTIIGDPSVTKTPDGWRMDYFASGPQGTEDWYSTTTDANFPIGWRQHDRNLSYRTLEPGPPGSFDSDAAHKPFIFHYGGKTLHYYTAVQPNNTGRRVALAIEGQVPIWGDMRTPVTPSRISNFAQMISHPSTETTFTCPANGPYLAHFLPRAKVLAREGDILEMSIAYVANNGAGDLRVDACTRNSADAVVNYVSGLGSAGHGVTAWGSIGGRYDHGGGVFHYRVQAADLIKGTVTISPLWKAEGSSRDVLNSAADPTFFTVRNLSIA